MEYKVVNFNADLCSNISPKLHKQLLKLALKSLNQLDVAQDVLAKFKEDNNITSEEFCSIIEMYISIIHLFLRCNNKEEFEDTLQSHGYPTEFIENLLLKYDNRESILLFTKDSQHSIKDLNYKIDISLHNNVLNKVILPSIIFLLKYEDSKDIAFSVDSSTFHKLRYNVALMVKELNSLKNTSIMKKQ